MEYISTRGSAPALDFEGVTLAGLASDGGLYVPAEWPRFSEAEIRQMRGLAYPDAKIEAIPVWQTAPYFDAKERLVLAYADRLVTHQGRVPDALFVELKEQFSDEEILELTYTTAMYHMHAIMSRALRTEFDDRDDPITEVPAPEGFDALDFLGGKRKND